MGGGCSSLWDQGLSGPRSPIHLNSCSKAQVRGLGQELCIPLQRGLGWGCLSSLFPVSVEDVVALAGQVLWRADGGGCKQLAALSVCIGGWRWLRRLVEPGGGELLRQRELATCLPGRCFLGAMARIQGADG